MTESDVHTSETSESQKAYFVDPYKHQKKYSRKRYEEDAAFRAQQSTFSKDWQRKKYATDPIWREQVLEKSRRRYQANKEKSKRVE